MVINLFCIMLLSSLLCGHTHAFMLDAPSSQNNKNHYSIINLSLDTIIKITRSYQYDERTVAKITPSETPEKFIASATIADDKAKAELDVADRHRNHGTNFAYVSSIKESFRLYEKVMNDPDVSPDLRMRAKINYAEIYPYVNIDDYSSLAIQQRKTETIQLFDDALQNSQISVDMKGWCKRHFARLLLSYNFDIEPAQAKQRALTLLNEVIDDKTTSIETRTRARLQLASHFIDFHFDIPKPESIAKATQILTDILKESTTPADLKGEAIIQMVNIEKPDEDPYYAQKLKLLNEMIVDATYSTALRARIKDDLADTYLSGKFDIKQSEALAASLKLRQELASDMNLDEIDRFKYQEKLAICHVFNLFRSKQADSAKSAMATFQLMLRNTSVSINALAEIKGQLAHFFIQKYLTPDNGKDPKTAAFDLINEPINDLHVSKDLWYSFKMKIIDWYERSYSIIGLKKSAGREEAIRLATELQNDERLTVKQKENIQHKLDHLNYIRRQDHVHFY